MNPEKEIICSEINNLSRDDQIKILTIIKQYDKTKIQKFSDGSRVDLDVLPESLIRDIYLMIKNILNLD